MQRAIKLKVLSNLRFSPRFPIAKEMLGIRLAQRSMVLQRYGFTSDTYRVR